MNEVEYALQKRYIAEAMTLGLNESAAKDFVQKLWPEVEIVEQTSILTTYRVTHSVWANIASSCIGGDINARFHTGKRAIFQSSVLINACCVVIGRFAGGVLLNIAPDISFDNALKVGEPALIRAEQIDWGDKVRITKIQGWTPSGASLFGERTVTTRTPKISPR